LRGRRNHCRLANREREIKIKRWRENKDATQRHERIIQQSEYHKPRKTEYTMPRAKLLKSETYYYS